MTKTMIKSAIIACVLAMTAGCATSGVTQAELDQAMRKAEAAQAAANQAQQTAMKALETAREAKQCCKANSQRLERMFEASQRK